MPGFLNLKEKSNTWETKQFEKKEKNNVFFQFSILIGCILKMTYGDVTSFLYLLGNVKKLWVNPNILIKLIFLVKYAQLLKEM